MIFFPPLPIPFSSYLRVILHTHTGRCVCREPSHGLTMSCNGCMDLKQIKRPEVICYGLWITMAAFALCMPCTQELCVICAVRNRCLLYVKTIGKKETACHEVVLLISGWKVVNIQRDETLRENQLLIRSWSVSGANVKIIQQHCFAIEPLCVRVIFSVVLVTVSD